MMPNAESRPNYCSLWSGSNLWNIWVNYLPPLARLRRVSWPWHALFMFNIIMKSPLCKLCNYFKWSYNNVRHLTGCSTRAKIKFNLRDARVHGGLSNPNLCILRICTMIQLDAGLWKFTELRQLCHARRAKERSASFIYKQRQQCPVSTDLTMFDKLIFRQFWFPIPQCEVTRGPGRVTPLGPGSPQPSRSVVAWLSQG